MNHLDTITRLQLERERARLQQVRATLRRELGELFGGIPRVARSQQRPRPNVSRQFGDADQ